MESEETFNMGENSNLDKNKKVLHLATFTKKHNKFLSKLQNEREKLDKESKE